MNLGKYNNKNWRSDFIKSILNKVENNFELEFFFRQYISFNSVFAGCVSSLAGKFHIAQISFYKNEIDFLNIYSHSSQIASNIFAAAEDEYNAKKNSERVTHREMSCFFYDSLLEFFNAKNRISTRNDYLNILIDEAKTGYAFQQEISDSSLFNALGFHIASEELADQEFTLIDNYLESKYGELVSFLREKKHKSGLNAYYWIKSHCTVEKDHHENALTALKIALNYYSGDLSRGQLEEQVSNGYKEFCILQEKLFNTIVDFNSSENKKSIEKYIEIVLEPKNEKFGNFSACPYASKEKNDNHIIYQSAQLKFENLESTANQIKSVFLKNIDKTLLTYDTKCLLTVSEFQELGKRTSELLFDDGIVVIGLHPNDSFNIQGFRTRTVPFPLFLIQSKGAITNGRLKLKQTPYYKNWTDENLNHLDNLFGKYL